MVRITGLNGRAEPGDPLVGRPHSKSTFFCSVNLEHGASAIGTRAIHNHLTGFAFHARGKYEFGLLDFVGRVVIRRAVDGYGTGTDVRFGVTIHQVDRDFHMALFNGIFSMWSTARSQRSFGSASLSLWRLEKQCLDDQLKEHLRRRLALYNCIDDVSDERLLIPPDRARSNPRDDQIQRRDDKASVRVVTP